LNVRMLTILLLTILTFFSWLAACSSREEAAPEPPSDPRPEGAHEDEEKPVEYPTYRGPRNPYTNEPADGENISRRPILVIMDNHSQARPQLGLARADLVFEVMAEGGFTRLLTVFLGSAPEEVGPIRSARPYHLDLVQSLDAVLVHCGASPEGYRQIESREMAVFNDLWGAEGFYRDQREGVSFEHTLFASLSEIREAMDEREMEHVEGPESIWNFSRGAGSGPEWDEADLLRVNYPGYAGYTVEYHFAGDRGVYLRYIGDRPHSDAAGDQISVANVLVVQVPAWPKPGDTEGRLNMDMFAGGDGKLVSGGKVRDIQWQMEPHSPMRFTGADGEDVHLREGTTWVQIVPPDSKVHTERGEDDEER